MWCILSIETTKIHFFMLTRPGKIFPQSLPFYDSRLIWLLTYFSIGHIAFFIGKIVYHIQVGIWVRIVRLLPPSQRGALPYGLIAII